MLIIFQLLFALFVLFAIVAVLRKKQEGLLGPKGAVFWVIFWLLAAGVVVWPESASVLANTFGIGRGVDLIIYIAIALLFYLVFKLHIKLESLGRDLTKVVRKQALEEHKK